MIRQRGVVLISVLILVALAAIVAATVFFETAMSARRTAASFGMEQALELGVGAEALAAYALSQDKNQQDYAAEDWGMPYGPHEVEPGVSLEARLTDEQGKFNINTLVRIDGKRNESAYTVFARLLDLCGLDASWGDLIVDWIDQDSTPRQSGAEDATYMSRMPSHLTSNQPLTSISELQQIPGFTRQLYDKLEPHVTALPPTVAQINVCTADGLVLDSLYALSKDHQNYVEHSQRSKDEMDKLRENGCFPTRALLVAVDPKIAAAVTERSNYFRLETWIDIGSAEFALYSLMYRNGGQARAVARSLGTR